MQWMTVADYMAELAFRLRWRHVGEARVREELVRVSDEARDGEVPSEDRFGKPADYARTIARGKSPSPGFLVASGLAAIAVVVVAIRVVNSLILGREQNVWISLAIYLGAFLWVLTATAVGARLDRRIPVDLQ